MYDRIDVRFKPENRGKIISSVKALEKTGKIAGAKVRSINKLDGTKFMLADNEWILFRFSGTEPLLRIYSEAPTAKRVKANLNFGVKITK